MAGLLRSGRWFPAIVDSDAHNPDQIVGLPHTVVHADSLARGDLLAGLKAGRSYLVESSSAEVSFTATADRRTTSIGDRLPVRTGTPVDVELTVAGVPGTTAAIHDQNGLKRTASVPDSGSVTLTWTTYSRYSQWIRAEVRRASGGINSTVPNAMVAMTNPIFLGKA